MARDTLTTIQYSLERKEQKLRDLTTKVFLDKLMALARDGKGIATIKEHGRALTAYFNIMLYPGGGKGLVAESGTYPTDQQESETQASVALKMFAMTLGYTEHALKAMESDPSKMKVSTNVKIKAAVEGMQRWMADQFAGRGDGTIGRTAAAGAPGTEITLDGPVLCSPGDIIYSNPTRAIATAGGESGKIEGARVLDVKYDEQKIAIASDTWDDADVIHFYGAAENAGGDTNWVQGIQAAYDNVADNFQYDADDDATYDHVDTYLGLTRSTTTKANCQEYSVGDYPTLAAVQRMFSRCLAHGANPRDLVSLWNPLTYEKFCEGIQGYTPKSVNLKLPGNNFSVPVISAVGPNLPVLDSYRIPRDKILVVDKSKIYRLTAPGGWNKRAGTFWKQVQVSAASGSDAAMKAEYRALFDVWYQLAVVLPDTACVGYGVTTT
ncbi:MAG: hypothetical protein ACETWB_02430 [Anaerolineae bacterium]